MSKQITINGQKFEHEGETISYEKIVAYEKLPPGIYSVTYKSERSGILYPNKSVNVTDGMRIDIYDTSNA